MLIAIRNTIRATTNAVIRSIYTTTPQATEKFDHKRIPADDEGVQGEKIIDLDSVLKLYVYRLMNMMAVSIKLNWTIKVQFYCYIRKKHYSIMKFF